MSIASRIQAIEQHLTDDYSVLTLAGADLTNVDKNIINLKPTWKERLLYFINNGTDEVYDNWDKVTGEGTSLTLNNTLEAKMKIVLKGNTYQDSTTGKNLFNINGDVNTRFNGTTTTTNIVSGNDLIVSINTAVSHPGGQKIYVGTGNSVTLSAKLKSITYNTQPSANDGVANMIFYNDNTTANQKGMSFNYSEIGTRKSVTFTAATDYIYATFGSRPASTSATYTDIQVELGGTTDYEPYCGGIPSPNPDYPQDIHVVSGDNEITICGKNLLDRSACSVNFALNWGTGANFGETGSIASDYIQTTKGQKFTIAYSSQVMYYDKNKEYLGCLQTGGQTIAKTTGNTWKYFTTPNYDEIAYMRLGIRKNSDGGEDKTNKDIMLNREYVLEPYEPYQSKEYEVNLPVENLWKTISSTTKNGITLTYNEDGSYTLDGTATANSSFYVSASYPVGTYTLSANNPEIMAGGADYLLLETQGGTSTNKTLVLSLANNKATFDITSPITTLVIVISSGKTYNNFVIKPQLEKGSKANSFTKYGTTPIWLGWIGTYQDKIDKSTGKNLFDSSQLLQAQNWVFSNGYYNGQVEKYYVAFRYGFTFANSFKENTQYTLKLKAYTTGGNPRFRFEYTDGSAYNLDFTATSPTEYTYTTTSGKTLSKIIGEYGTGGSQTLYLTNIMLNEGSTPLPYEPYGTSWYLKKEIGKVVLNGSEGWSAWKNGFNEWNYYRNYPELAKDFTGLYMISNYFTFNNTYQDSRAGQFNVGGINPNRNGNIVFNPFGDTTNKVSEFATWLSTHNTEVLFPLETPTFTEITGTLKEQLEAIKMSYEGQTNLSQTNNNLASVLNASALSE